MALDNFKKANLLYERDYYLWIEPTIDLLQEQKFNEIDLVSLIEK